MKFLTILLFVLSISHLNFVYADENSTTPIIFMVKTLKVNVNNDSTVPLPGTFLSAIKPIGIGNASDLQCEGISNEEGEMICVVNSCQKNSPLPNTYHIVMQPPSEFGEMTPAQVKVFHCDVTPKSAAARFIEKTLIVAKFNSDAQYVLGENVATILNGQTTITTNQYSDKLSSLLNKPSGTFSAIKMRKLFQDYSLNAVNSNESAKANKYSALTVTHANVWLNEWARKNGVSVEVSNLDRMETLNMNIKTILGENSDNKSVLIYQEQLKFLKDSIAEGELANQQFETIESFSIQ